ncbi:MAG: tetratricopeptide repeat-containing sensor histidine kinase [Microscillaceae bacterium]|jgi:signal transduction histidine kinase|nr:tetratricopeptide repeat-containing sensor histidine kinase [Microscillaceae bacterium]
MKTILLLGLWLGSVSWGLSQNKIEQLQKKINVILQSSPSFVRDTTHIGLLNELSWEYRNVSADTSILYAQKALRLAQKIQWDLGVGMSYKRLGVAHRNKGNYPQTIDSFLQALRVFERLKDSLNMAGCYSNIGLVFQRKNNLPSAIKYFEQAMWLYNSQKNVRGVLNSSNNLGMTYYKQKNYQVALQYYYKSLDLEKQVKDDFIRTITYRNLSEVQLALHEYPKAIESAQVALKVARESNNKIGVTSTLNNLARIYLKKGEIKQAIEYAQAAIDEGRLLGAKEYLKDAYFVLYECYAAQQDDKNTLKYYQQFIQYRDSLYNEENGQMIAELQNRFAMEKKQTELELAKKDQQFKLLLIYSLSGASLFVLLVLFLLLRNNWRKQKTNQVLTRQTTEILAKNAELANQNDVLAELDREKDGLIDMVAHDLRAPLNRVRGLIELIQISGGLNDDQKTYLQLMDKTSESGLALIRDLLDINHLNPIDAEIHLDDINLSEFIPNFLQGYEAQFHFKDISLHQPSVESVVTIQTDASFLQRILDNLVSNALKFSYRDSNIYVNWYQNASTTSISVKDEGQGISLAEQSKLFRKFQTLSARPTAGEESTGLGLAIVKSLVERLQGRIEVISDAGKGAEFIVHLPKQYA